MDLFCGLRSKVLQPNMRTYYMIIVGLCKGGMIREVKKVLREMKNKGCFPGGWTYNMVIRGFIRNNETLRAMELIRKMMQKGFSADASTT